MKTVAKSDKQIISDFSVMIGGEAGAGVQSAGKILASVCARAGLHVFANAEYPSLIRGGHNSYLVRISNKDVNVHTSSIDFLMPLNTASLTIHQPNLRKDACVLVDSQWDLEGFQLSESSHLFKLPLGEIAAGASDNGKGVNMVALGVLIGLVNIDFRFLQEVIEKVFKRKGEEIVKANIKAAKAGFDYSSTLVVAYEFAYPEEVVSREVVSGAEILSRGALRAGVNFLSAYPMTPASGVLHFLAKAAGKNPELKVVHTEDEIAAINMAIGASWAGARSMTATSGGGFSLMTEGLGMAGMIEAPLVVVEAMRGGPSTGLPTRTEQSDLLFVINASQGEFPRMVIAPKNLEDLYYSTFEAFNIADRFQMPVIILVDKFLMDSIKTIEELDRQEMLIDRGKLVSSEAQLQSLLKSGYETKDGGFKRFKLEDDGVSYRTVPGTKGGRHRASTDEHLESGDLSEDEENRVKMHDKRMSKLASCLQELPVPLPVGPGLDGTFGEGPAFENPDLTLVTFGSGSGAALEAINVLKQHDIKANLLIIKYLQPFHAEEVTNVLTASPVNIVIEMNREKQLAAYIRHETGVRCEYNITKYSGRQLTTEEILEELKKLNFS